VNVVSTEDFINAVKGELSYNDYNFFICAAAISDYSPTNNIEGKISSDNVKELQII